MGLKKVNYTVTSLDLVLPTAYAIISKLEVDKMGNGKALFEIQQDRENAENSNPLETKEVNFIADKTGAIYEQAYLAGKADIFVDWEDDIIIVETIEEEIVVE